MEMVLGIFAVFILVIFLFIVSSYQSLREKWLGKQELVIHQSGDELVKRIDKEIETASGTKDLKIVICQECGTARFSDATCCKKCGESLA
jgi:ribosomal protein L40E